MKKNNLENKKTKNFSFFKILISGFVVIAILGGVFSFALLGFNTHAPDKLEDVFEIDKQARKYTEEII